MSSSSLLINMCEGALASCGATLFSNPFEVCKIRLQLQGELQRAGHYTVHYHGLLDCLFKTATNEGLRGLQRGLGTSLVHQSVLNGIRLGGYQPLKLRIQDAVGVEGHIVNVVAGATMGVVGAFCGSPLFLVKTRLRARSSVVAVGVQHSYRGLFHALSTIAREKGVRGLYHGSRMVCVRTAFGSAAQLPSYDASKSAAVRWTGLHETDVKVHIFSSCVGSMVTVGVMNPFDVITTRCYNNDSHAYQRGWLSSMQQIVAVEGLPGLYKGSMALWSRLAPHTIITFVLLEKVRSGHLFGYSPLIGLKE